MAEEPNIPSYSDSSSDSSRNRLVHHWTRFLLLFSGAALRLIALGDVPPGLTHDEADHGLSAWQIVNGARPIYLTVGNGREPLYDYITALFMSFLGPTFLANRLVSAFSAILLLSAGYVLIRKLFTKEIALFALAGMSLGFWPLMTARQGLRSTLLPVLVTLAVYFWWRCIDEENDRRRMWAIGFAGLCLGLSFYTYLAARIMWLLLPAGLALWLLFDRERFRKMWRPTLAVLLIAGLLSSPLWLYLIQNPEAEQRVGQLTQTLEAAAAGEWGPLGETLMEGVRLIPFRGDLAWRYNIPDRPLLSPWMAALFGVGLVLVLTRSRVSGPTGFAFVWILLGLVPAFITGRFLATTQVIGLQPMVYLFPALTLDWMVRHSIRSRAAARLAVIFLFLFIAAETAQAYFVDWGQHPQVRLQYESTLVAAIDVINDRDLPSAAISSATPDRFHAQPIGLLTLHNQESSLRWFDGQRALVIPQGGDATLIASQAAPIAPIFADDLVNIMSTESIDLREDDLDPRLDLITLNGADQITEIDAAYGPSEKTAVFGDLVRFVGSDVLTDGSTIEVKLLFEPLGRLDDDLVLFTQLLGPDGTPIAQMDRLSAPASAWVAGDRLIQWHTLTLPAEGVSGPAPMIIGFYDPNTGQRLTTESGADHIMITTLE